MTAPRTRLLLAEDDPVTRLVASSTLEDAGYEVVLAEDGVEAVQLFESHRPACVILDVMMPRLDGFGACRDIRTLPGGSNVPVLILTSRDDVEAVARAYDVGATDFMAKGASHRLLTERVRFLLRADAARRNLAISQGRLLAVQDMARVGHWELDPGGRPVDMSPIVARLLDCAPGVFPGIEALRDALGPEGAVTLEKCLARWRNDHDPFHFEGRLRSGGYVYVKGAATPHADPGALTLAIQDVTTLRRAQQEAHRLAYYDPVTALPNRRRFLDALEVMVGDRNRESLLCVMVVDLRGHERVQQSGGAAAVDELIVSAAQRIHVSACGQAAPGRVLAHLGQGSFALALPDCDSPLSAASTAGRIMETLAHPIESDDCAVTLGARVGIAMWPQDGSSAEALLAAAQAAAIQSRSGDAQDMEFFAPEIRAAARRRVELESSLRKALERRQLRLVYQPRVELEDLHIHGVEALIRWEHPQRGTILPLDFISLAEESGLIQEIGAWVMREACRQAAAWRRHHNRAVTVSVNVSSRQLDAPAELVALIREALDQSGLPPGGLEIELTESMVIHAGPEVLTALEELRLLGVSVALDDFGTGYSSLGYLRRLPVDCLKIDQSFVSDLPTDTTAESVLRAIISVADALRLRTVAEGIETIEQYRLLRGHGCREGQGFLFGKPLTPEQFDALVASRSSLALPCAGRAPAASPA